MRSFGGRAEEGESCAGEGCRGVERRRIWERRKADLCWERVEESIVEMMRV